MLRNLIIKFASFESKSAVFTFTRYKNTVALTDQYDMEEIEDTLDSMLFFNYFFPHAF